MSSSVASPELSRTALTAGSRFYALDSNLAVRDYLRRTLATRYNLKVFSEEQALLECLNSREAPDLILLEWESMEKSLTVLSHIRAGLPDVPIVMLSCTSEVKDFEVVTRIGARGIVLKPFMDGNLENAIEEHLAEAQKALPGELQAQSALVAKSDIPVLILGESGTGKEILALYTHKMSNRAHRMFLKVNCAAMPADLLESELFGYEQGAFTGAVKTKPGKFEVCTGGTIFLDEIGEMPAILQAKLLQVLQDGTFSRLGSRSPMKVDVRVIAATNINMKEAMANKTFREDLYYRLNGFTLNIPPLRERREEIPVLAEYFMRKGAKRYGREALPFSQTLLDVLAGHSWPGNLRELENVINRYLVLGEERSIVEELSPSAAYQGAAAAPQEVPNGAGLKAMVRNLKGEAEATAIAQMLENKGWNRKAAASELQISYKALLYKIKQYELVPKRA